MCTAKVLLLIIYHLFPGLRLEWVSKKKKEKRVGGEGLQRLSKRSWAFVGFVGKCDVWAGETGAGHGLVASFCLRLSSAGLWKNSSKQTHFTGGL